MWRWDRPAVQTFGRAEDLYYRLAPAQIVQETVTIFLGPPQPPFSVPFSVNWSRFSEPDWVLIPPSSDPGRSYDGFKVGAIRVEDLPDSCEGFDLRPVHVPEEDNYSHTEVRTFVDGQPKRPGPVIRKKLREKLSRVVRVLSLDGSPADRSI